MSVLPNIKAIFAVVALVLMGLATTPMALATTADMPMAASAMNQNGPCMHHENGDQAGTSHACCQDGSDQTCPDDMDCGGNCASMCASAVFLTTASALVARPARHDVFAPTGTPFVPHQSTLNAPPPRA